MEGHRDLYTRTTSCPTFAIHNPEEEQQQAAGVSTPPPLQPYEIAWLGHSKRWSFGPSTSYDRLVAELDPNDTQYSPTDSINPAMLLHYTAVTSQEAEHKHVHAQPQAEHRSAYDSSPSITSADREELRQQDNQYQDLERERKHLLRHAQQQQHHTTAPNHGRVRILTEHTAYLEHLLHAAHSAERNSHDAMTHSRRQAQILSSLLKDAHDEIVSLGNANEALALQAQQLEAAHDEIIRLRNANATWRLEVHRPKQGNAHLRSEFRDLVGQLG